MIFVIKQILSFLYFFIFLLLFCTQQNLIYLYTVKIVQQIVVTNLGNSTNREDGAYICPQKFMWLATSAKYRGKKQKQKKNPVFPYHNICREKSPKTHPFQQSSNYPKFFNHPILLYYFISTSLTFLERSSTKKQKQIKSFPKS